MKTTEIRELNSKELAERIEAETASLAQKKMNHSISPMDNPSELRKMRKDIARLKTELRWRELNNK
jgi:large subunit ribosomal protein L29